MALLVFKNAVLFFGKKQVFLDIEGTQGDGSVVLTRRSIYNTREPSPCVYENNRKIVIDKLEAVCYNVGNQICSKFM